MTTAMVGEWLASVCNQEATEMNALLTVNCVCGARSCACRRLLHSLGRKMLGDVFLKSGAIVHESCLWALLPHELQRGGREKKVILLRNAVDALNIGTTWLHVEIESILANRAVDEKISVVRWDIHALAFLRARLADALDTDEGTLSAWEATLRCVYNRYYLHTQKTK